MTTPIVEGGLGVFVPGGSPVGMSFGPIDPSANAAHAEAIRVAGQPVWFQRLVGAPPSVTTVPPSPPDDQTTWPYAVVRGMQTDGTEPSGTGYGASQVGGLSQTDRMIIVMIADLEAANFPLPLQKGDQVLLPTGELLVLTRVDPFKRAFAGAVEAYGAGID